MKPLELYIHIPFCIKKCYYCDFLSAPSGEKERQNYVEKLCADIKEYKELAGEYKVSTVFIGGGTPSVLEPVQIETVFEQLRDVFDIEEHAEITIEINPGTVTEEKFKAYRRAGINRLSIGLQSVNDDELKGLGRIHTYGEFLDTYRMARAEGFSNINIDLISAIPGQTVESWEKTLRTVAELSPEHISAYSLIIEEGTLFDEIYGEKRTEYPGFEIKKLPEEEEERQMYENTEKILAEYGFHRYEISNYAKSGQECRHNLGYWERKEYLGIGTGASSFLNHRRWEYGQEPELLTRQAEMEEYMFLGLRKIQGVSKEQFFREFGVELEKIYGEVLMTMTEQQLIETEEDYIRLTKKGIDISNYVMSQFLL